MKCIPQQPKRHGKAFWTSPMFLVVLLILLAQPQQMLAQTQWTTNGNNINNTNSGNVGIGTTSPTQTLDVAGRVVLSGSKPLTGVVEGILEIKTAVNNSNIGNSDISLTSTFSGNGDYVNSIFVNPTFAPSASITAARGTFYGPSFSPPSGVTITNAIAASIQSIYRNVSGAVTNGAGLHIYPPSIEGALKPTNQYGIHVLNQGISGTTTSYGLYVDSQSGSTNNYSAIFAGGNVGVGTAGPAYKLDVQGGYTSSSSGYISRNNPWSTADSAFFPNGITTAGATNWLYGGTTYIGNAPSNGYGHQFNAASGASHAYLAIGGGNVGIGTTNPAYKLDVQGGQLNASAGLCIAGDCKTSWSQVGGGVSSQWTTSGSSVYYNSGNVGIGTTAPATKVHIVSGNGNPNSLLFLDTGVYGGTQFQVGGTINNESYFNLNVYRGGSYTTRLAVSNYGHLVLQPSGDGNVGIGTTSPSTKLHVVGDVTVTGNIAAKYQDVAEWVESSQALPAGTVVVLDHTKSNQVIASSQAYDTRVAGVISAKPGIALGEQGAAKVLVATTGRVKVKVDASAGPIQVGDLLVTSDISGVAMKSEPVNIGGVQLHRPGTLIGKALEPLAKGTGEILVLLSLQ